MNGCVAVFDLGKTNMKVVVFDAAGKVVAERGHPNASVLPDARWPYRRLYTEGAWSFLIGALKELGAQFTINAISISAHGAAGVLVGDKDAALPAVDYEFDIDGPVAAEYDKVRPPFEETLSPNLPRGLNLGRQVYYLQRRFPAEFAAARAFLAYPQYWSWRLSGVSATEFTSIGSHTDLWRPTEGGLSSMVDRLGWRRLFPPMRKAWDALGTLKPEVASKITIHHDDSTLPPELAADAKARGAYGNELSADGNYFAGGGWPQDWVIFQDIRKGEIFELETRTPRAGPKRGGFDPDGNAWFGGTGGIQFAIQVGLKMDCGQLTGHGEAPSGAARKAHLSIAGAPGPGRT